MTKKPNNLTTQSPNNLRIVFFGSSKFVLPIMEVLKKHYELVLVLTTEKLATKGDPLQNCPVITFSKEHNIPYLSVRAFDHNTKYLIQDNKAPLAVLAYFGLILPKTILKLFPKGILNIHPSLLPKYRGPTPVQTAILNGETKTGITIIRLDEEVDHGPILVQNEEPMHQTDTSETLYQRLFAIGARLLEKTLNDYLSNKVVLKEQDHSLATFTSQLTRSDGYIDLGPNRPNPPYSPTELDRMIRAYHPWPGVWTKWEMANGKWQILKFLPSNKLQVEGRRPMTYKDFINGYPQARKLLVKLGLWEEK